VFPSFHFNRVDNHNPAYRYLAICPTLKTVLTDEIGHSTCRCSFNSGNLDCSCLHWLFGLRHVSVSHLNYRTYVNYLQKYHLLLSLALFRVFSPTASRMSASSAASSTVSPSWKSMARTVLLSRRVLKSFFGSFI
jgi:hypothetical protein